MPAGGSIQLFWARSPKTKKCLHKKPTEQDFVSTSPNLDALRNDKGRRCSTSRELHIAFRVAIQSIFLYFTHYNLLAYAVVHCYHYSKSFSKCEDNLQNNKNIKRFESIKIFGAQYKQIWTMVLPDLQQTRLWRKQKGICRSGQMIVDFIKGV